MSCAHVGLLLRLSSSTRPRACRPDFYSAYSRGLFQCGLIGIPVNWKLSYRSQRILGLVAGASTVLCILF